MSNDVDRSDTVTTPLGPEEKRRQYNRAVRQAQLVTILLSSFTFKVNREMDRPPINEWKPSYDGKLVSFAFDEEKQILLARVSWNVEIKIKRRNYVKCVATYDVVYNNFSDLNDDIAMLIAENIARPATYAYFRALFASVDWAANIGAPPLPVIKFHPKV
jgi:hypothetical protein